MHFKKKLRQIQCSFYEAVVKECYVEISKEKSAITMCARKASKLLLVTHITC